METQGRSLEVGTKQMPLMNAAYWLAFSGLLCYLFVQLSLVPSSDTCSQRAGPSSVKNIFLQICPQSSPKEGILQLKFPLAHVMSACPPRLVT